MADQETKVILVTAASRGMGAACARELAGRGYRTVLLARSPEVEALAKELSGVAFVGSVTDEKALEGVVALAIDTYGRIDGVVNNTGHPPKGDLLEIPDAEWHAGLDLVLLNVVRLARLVVPLMERQGGGAFVNISSFAAEEPSLRFPVSSALRAGLSSFTKLFADRYAASGIRMNSILAGYIDSYPIDESIRTAIPMARSGTVAEIGRTVAFLLSSEAGYITGQNLRVDGGLGRSI